MLEDAQVEVFRRAGGTDELERRLEAGGPRVGHRVDGAGEAAGDLEPPVGVHAAVAARHAGVPPDGERDLAARAGELVGDLDARGRGSDDEHAAGRQGVGVAVGAGREHALGVEAGRDPRTPVWPGRDDDVVGTPGAGVGVDAVARRRC